MSVEGTHAEAALCTDRSELQNPWAQCQPEICLRRGTDEIAPQCSRTHKVGLPGMGADLLTQAFLPSQHTVGLGRFVRRLLSLVQ